MSVRSVTALLACLALPLAASAQPAQQSGGTMQGFQMNRDQPVKIEANSLEVRDKQKQATFIGSVKLTQGETVLQCQRLVIFYDDNAAPAAPKKGGGPATAQKAAGPGSQQIKRAEAKGDVLVTQKDQTARGDNGVFDVKANNIVLTGNVVVTQGASVLRGDQMVVNLTTGFTEVKSGKTSGRVEGLFNPSTTQPQATPAPAAPQKDAKPAPAPQKPAPVSPSAKQAPGQPIRIN
jgi:lipopolysaccharide export system protein LptA